ncbi:MAG: DUF1553 domain-containing protein [Pirellulales bacterium]
MAAFDGPGGILAPRFASPWAGALGLLVTLLAPLSLAQEADLFRTRVAPLLEARCLHCHNAAERSGGLSFETTDDALTGGDSGESIAPGASADSLLVDYISGSAPMMPKDGEPLTPDQVALIRRWIDSGAKWPAGLRLSEPVVKDTDWWSLRLIEKPPVPVLSEEDAAWARTPIDAFLVAKMREHGLSPSPAADRRTLIRRLYFDLIGLSPSPQEVEAFLADRDPRAYENLVERLLDSPHYGERWARHWLDVAHYGDTHGFDKDKLRPNAWPYRDYVIRAFNDDKPYGRFVEEQLAGDVLYPNSADGIVATGFIAAGPWDWVGHVELREGTIDKKNTRNLDRDDMVATAINTFASLTVQCARCHNHKFDPITQEDYYSLQAVFAGVERGDRDYYADPELRRRRSELLARQRELRDRQQALQQQIARQESPEIRSLDQRQQRLQARLDDLPVLSGEIADRTLGYHSQIEPAPESVKWVQVDLGEVRPIEHVLLFPAHVAYGGHDGPGFGFPPRFRVEVSDDAEFAEGVTVLADHTAADFPNPRGTSVAIEAPRGTTGRYVRVTTTRLWERTEDYIFALSELAVLSDRQNIAADRTVTARDTIEASSSWGRNYLVDGMFGLSSVEQLAQATAGSPSNGYHSQLETTPDAEKWVQIDLGSPQAIDQIRLVPARPTDYPDTPGFGFPLRYKVEVSSDPDFEAASVIVDHTDRDVANPGDQPVTIGGDEPLAARARYVRLTATRLWERREDFALALAEMQVLQGDRNLAEGGAVTALDSIDTGRWSAAYLVDGYSSRSGLHQPHDVWDGLLRRIVIERELNELRVARAAMLDRLVDADTLQAVEQTAADLSEVEARLASLPGPQAVFAVQPREPRPIHVLGRGEVTSPRDEVVPGTVGCLDLVSRFELAEGHEEGQRRAALATWLVDRRNPLTWRSIVNRVWLYHFGRGIVETPNDFGRMGAEPTHPELLDWLAAEFRDGSQSLKDLHRLMVTSAAYRQSSLSREDAAEADRGNRFLWRMNRRKLEAEAVRDTVLLLAGKLDRQMYGPGFEAFVIEKPEHSPHYLYGKHDVDDPASHRRSIYRFIVRSVPDPFMEVLDCADPSLIVERRNETLTALQSLALLNNPLVVRMSEHFAARLQAGGGELPQQIDRAYCLALGRAPTEEESRLLVEFASEHGLPSFCRLLFNTNELMFVD